MKNNEKIKEIRDDALHEKKRHADIMFAYNVYPCTIPLDFAFVPLHWQDSFEIVYVKRGKGIVQVDFDTYEAEAGDIFIVLPGHLHGLRQCKDERMEYENIIFDKSFLGHDIVDLCSQKYLQPLINEKINIPVFIRHDHEMHAAVSSSLDASDVLCDKRPKGYELGVKGYLHLLFSVLFQMSEEKTDYNMEQKNVQKMKIVLAYLEENFDKKITVDDMAAECGYSGSHFMRWFKEMTGTGFGSYLIEYRLGKAAHELRTTEDTVLEIAEKTGFENLSNFNRLFKKRYATTPSQFRKELI